MIHFLQWAQIWAHPWAAGMIRACVQGGIALALAWLVCRVFNRIPAWLQCWLWRLAYLKLFVGLLAIGPIALPLLKPRADSIPRPIVVAAQATNTIPVRITSAELPRNTFLPLASRPIAPQSPAPVSVDWTVVLMLAWLAGCAVVLAKITRQGIATARIRKACRPVTDPSLLALYARVAADLGLVRPPALVMCDRAPGPLLLGMARPQIVLPPQLPGWSENSCSRRACSPYSRPGTGSKLSGYTDPAVRKHIVNSPSEKLECLLAHELAHHQRRDLWWSWVPAIAATLFWFHPMVWLAGREWRLSRESACDAAAISVTGSSSAAYGRILLDVVASWRAPIHTLTALGIIESCHTLERRLLAMRHFSNGSTRRWILCGFAIAFVGIIGLLPWRLVAKEPGKKSIAQDAKSPATQPVWDAHHPIHDRELRRFHGATESQVDFAIWSEDNLVSGNVGAAMAGASARAGGTIKTVDCKEGQHVKKGELLIQLDDTRARAALAAAEAELEFTKLEYKRKQQLAERKAISPTELQEAELQVAKQEAAVRMANLDVQDMRVISPLSGIVFRCDAQAQQYVQPGSVLARVIDTESLTVEFQADADQSRHLEAGRKIRVGIPRQSEQLDATIIFVSPLLSGDRNEVKATVENRDHLLKSGMSVTVNLQFYPQPLQSYPESSKPSGQ